MIIQKQQLFCCSHVKQLHEKYLTLVEDTGWPAVFLTAGSQWVAADSQASGSHAASDKELELTCNFRHYCNHYNESLEVKSRIRVQLKFWIWICFLIRSSALFAPLSLSVSFLSDSQRSEMDLFYYLNLNRLDKSVQPSITLWSLVGSLSFKLVH